MQPVVPFDTTNFLSIRRVPREAKRLALALDRPRIL
jgi:hypothetical protein